MLIKYCYKCQENKPIDAFCKNKSKKDGMSTECRPCKRQGDKAYYQSNSEQVKQTVAKYRQENPEKVSQVKKDWYAVNKEHVHNKSNAYRKAHPEKASQYQRNYKQANSGKARSWLAKYRATKLKATPLWFEKNLVETVYIKAKEWNLAVDHIVPLQGKTVCGLHCWDNLQLLDPALNSAKRNHYWPDMP